MSGKRSRIQSGYRAKSEEGRGRCRLICNPDYVAFEVFAVNRATDPPTEKRIGFPTMRVFENGDKEVITHTAESLVTGFQPYLKRVKDWGKVFHGKDDDGVDVDDWVLEVRAKEE